MTRFPILPGSVRLLALAALIGTLGGCGGGGADGGAAAPQAETGNTGAAAQASPDTGTQQALAATGTSLPAAPAGLRGNVVCTNQRIGAITLDNLVVAANSACQLVGTTLTGSLAVEVGASVDAQGIRTNGSVQGEGAALVSLGGNSRIAGAVQVRQGGSAHVTDSVIAGDLQIEAMAGPVVASGNQVAGSLQAAGNLGGLRLIDNAIRGNLQCSENLPLPVFSGNSAAAADGQCSGGATGGSGGTGGQAGGGTTPPAPLTGNVTCAGLTIGAARLDSVTVPAGAVCTLQGTQLQGKLEIGAGAQLVADSITVGGGVVAEGAASVRLGGASTITGNVQFSGGGAASLVGITLRGDLQIDGMAGQTTASGNRVSGNLQAVGNRGGLLLLGNTVGGAMQCKDNLPAPAGSGNTAATKQDQCRPL